MVTLQSMQFTAAVLMMALTLKLLLLHGRRSASVVATNSRWLMIAATLMLGLHFALQLSLGLRLMGVTQAVMLNLVMLMPASCFYSWAIMLLQRRGQLTRTDWLAGPIAWGLTIAMLGIAAATDGEPLLSDTPELRKAELAGGTVYMLMQCYYTVRETMNLMAMRRALHDYYDSDTYGMLAWMQQSIVSLMLLALMVPLVIFGYGRWLLLIALIIYFTIFYLVDSFCSYLNSNAPARVLAAEVNAEEVEQKVDEEGKIPPPIGGRRGRNLQRRSDGGRRRGRGGMDGTRRPLPAGAVAAVGRRRHRHTEIQADMLAAL